MALRIRLARAGTKKRPFYRIVVAEATAPRDGRFVERLGTYDPRLPHDNAGRIYLKGDRVKHWMSVGAKPSERVALFLGKAGLAPMPSQPNRPQKSAPKQKAQERAQEKADKAETLKKEAEEKAAAEKAAQAEAKAAAEEAKKEAAEKAKAEKDVEKSADKPAEEAKPEAKDGAES